jgi:hypothetical protein
MQLHRRRIADRKPQGEVLQRRPGVAPAPAPFAGPAPASFAGTSASLLQLQRAIGNQAATHFLAAQGDNVAARVPLPTLLLQRDVVKDQGQPTQVVVDEELPVELIARVLPGMSRKDLEPIMSEYRPPKVLYEIGAVFDAQGHVKRVQKGTGGSTPGAATVNMTKLTSGLSSEERTNMVLTHSHPKGYPLSAGDAGQAAKHNMAEVRAVGFTVTSLRRKGDKWVDLANDAIAWLKVQSDFDRFRQEWPLECERRMKTRQFKGLVGTEIRARDGTWLDVAATSVPSAASPASFLDTYWACANIAKTYDAEFTDGLQNDLSAYAYKVLTELFNVEADVAKRAFL